MIEDDYEDKSALSATEWSDGGGDNGVGVKLMRKGLGIATEANTIKFPYTEDPTEIRKWT